MNNFIKSQRIRLNYSDKIDSNRIKQPKLRWSVNLLQANTEEQPPGIAGNRTA